MKITLQSLRISIWNIVNKETYSMEDLIALQMIQLQLLVLFSSEDVESKKVSDFNLFLSKAFNRIIKKLKIPEKEIN